ncbi:MAG: VCBS repeat-containing protein [Planctomycetes bacterium]|nr:VCBS repeat-containing protein [Planctomycetota bacterium]
MLKFVLALGLGLALRAQGPGLELSELDFGRPIDDWFIFDLDGDSWREVLVFHDPDPDGRPFSLAHRAGDAWTIERGSIPRSVVSLALGRFGLGDGYQLALIHPDHVDFLARDGGGALAVVGPRLDFTNLIRSPLAGVPGFWHWPTDIDGDGHDDLFLPGDDGLVLHFGDGAGGFSPPLLLGMAGSRRVTRDSAGHLDFLRSYPRPVFSDLDADGRRDLAWFDSEGLTAWMQRKARVFDAEKPLTFKLPWLASLDSDGILEQTEVDLRDVDGDGRPDLFLSRMSTPATGLGDLRTTLVVLLNRPEEFFARRPDFALKVQGVIGNGPDFRDVDGDGALDLVYGSYGAGISDALQRMMGTVKVAFRIHRGTPKAASPFELQPSRLLDLDLSKDDFGRWGARRNFAVGTDLDGDGIGDLFRMADAGGGRHRLLVFKGGRKKDGELVFADEASASLDAGTFETLSLRSMRPGASTDLVLIRERSLGLVTFR